MPGDGKGWRGLRRQEGGSAEQLAITALPDLCWTCELWLPTEGLLGIQADLQLQAVLHPAPELPKARAQRSSAGTVVWQGVTSHLAQQQPGGTLLMPLSHPSAGGQRTDTQTRNGSGVRSNRAYALAPCGVMAAVPFPGLSCHGTLHIRTSKQGARWFCDISNSDLTVSPNLLPVTCCLRCLTLITVLTVNAIVLMEPRLHPAPLLLDSVTEKSIDPRQNGHRELQWWDRTKKSLRSRGLN